MPDYIKIEKGLGPDGRIAVVRFDRGDGINALSPEVMRQLTAVARSFEDDVDTSVVVLTGSAKTFSAGFDLKDPEGRARRTMDLGALRRSLKVGPRLTRAWQEMEQVTIGAIEGFCIGGGVALAVALDFRVMASNAHMRVPEIGLGMNMSWQSVPRMLHLIGPARTKQAVILADQRISAAEAYEWGLVEEVADPGHAFDAAMTLAAKIAAQPPLSAWRSQWESGGETARSGPNSNRGLCRRSVLGCGRPCPLGGGRRRGRTGAGERTRRRGWLLGPAGRVRWCGCPRRHRTGRLHPGIRAAESRR